MNTTRQSKVCFTTQLSKALLAACVAGGLLISTAAEARAPRSHSSTIQRTESNESELVEHGTYTNKDGATVHSPAHTKSGKAPSGATAKCRDGSFSFSANHRGTCSHHGGVSQWFD